MRLLQMLQASSLITCVSALAVRDSTSNDTTLPSGIAPSTEIPEDDPNDRPTQSRQLRPHPEATTDGFGDLPPTITSLGREKPTTTAPPDIGSVIGSYLVTVSQVVGVPSIHTERPESGWEVVPTSLPHVTPTPAAGPHREQSTDGFGQPTIPGVPGPATVLTEYSPRPVVTPSPAVTPPIITQGPVIFTPVPVTSVRVTTVDGKPTTLASTVNWQYVVGTATIPVNSPTMINNVPVAISIDPSGNTVFVAGSQSTTIPAPPQAQGISISTTVVDGTTKYVIGGQTLAPNQAITVGDVPISIGANGRSTVLVMGDLTTTFTAMTTSSATSGTASGAGSDASASATGARSAAASAHTQSLVLAKILVVAVALIRPFI